MSNERAAELAEKIASKLPLDRFDRITLNNSDAELTVAALRTYAPVTGDVREAVARAIEEPGVFGVEPLTEKPSRPNSRVSKALASADRALSVLQAAGWGPRASLLQSVRALLAVLNPHNLPSDAEMQYLAVMDEIGRLDRAAEKGGDA